MSNLTKEDLLMMYRWLLVDRRFEERSAQLYAQGKTVGFQHLSIGQEAITVGTCYGLRNGDLIMPTHRGKGKFLMKGISMRTIVAGMYGKGIGAKCPISHVGDLSLGVLAGTGLIGSGIPITVGAALALKMNKSENVAIHFFGDGAANRGDFHEGLNLAAILKLPIIFVCENNQYAIATPVQQSTAVENISVRSMSYGFPGITVDGNDVLAVYEATQEAVERARMGDGPSLIECKTYRWKGHGATDPDFYRSEEERKAWLEKCSIKRFEIHLAERGIMEPAVKGKFLSEIDDEINDAVEYAEALPHPDPDELLNFIGRGSKKESSLQ